MYLLDTNMLSNIVRHPFGRAASRVEAAEPGSVVTSIIVACELRYGVQRRGSDALRSRIDGTLRRVAIVPLGRGVDRHYATIRVTLERAGMPIGAHDMFIAAHALSLGATLVTDNEREFRRVEGLAVENWLRD